MKQVKYQQDVAHTGPQVVDFDTLTYQLEPHETKMITDAVSQLSACYGSDDFFDFLFECHQSGSLIPPSLSKLLFNFSCHGNSRDYLLIKGLPKFDNLPKTPIKKALYRQSVVDAHRSMMAIVTSYLGYIYNFDNKKNADFIEEIFPVYAHKDQQMGSNSSVFLDWHVEDGFHPAKADYVALNCLRSDPTVTTYVFSAKRLDLPPEVIEVLTRKEFYIYKDLTFADDSEQERVEVSVLSSSDSTEIIFDPAFMICKNQQAEEALQQLTEYVNAHATEIVLEEGDLFVFDNRRVLHARSPYQPKFDGSDRWLLRALLLDSLSKVRHCIKGRDMVVV